MDDVEKSGSSDPGEALAGISKKYEIAAIYAFGSRAKEAAALIHGEFDGLSDSERDLDIAVLPETGIILSTREKVEITLKLEELFGVSRVDLVSLPEADPFLAANAIRGERLYSSDHHASDEYELFVLRRAGDLIPLERERIRLIMEEKE